MRLDGLGRSLYRHRLDDIGVQSSLHQVFHFADTMRFLLEYSNEFISDELPLLLGIGDARQHVQKPLRRIDTAYIQVKIILKHGKNLLVLVLAQHSRVDEDTDETIADRTR